MRFSSDLFSTTVACLLFLKSTVLAKPCVVFDTNFNLYAFGVQGKNDWKLGTQAAWAQGSSITVPSQINRPPFDGINTQCFLAQFQNAIYIINADNANPTNVHIYDPMNDQWSVQPTDVSVGVKPESSGIVLDHDTNVFFAMSEGMLYELRMDELRVGVPVPRRWEPVRRPEFNTQNYTPLMGLARNHIHFLNVPGNAAGQANIFIVHFAIFQAEVQAFPAKNGNTFPAQPGQTTSIFEPSETFAAQTHFAFIPDDNSATYVINAIDNSTTSLPAPPGAKPAYYAASTSALVQLAPDGQLTYLPFTASTSSIATDATKWSPIINPQWSPEVAISSISSGLPGSSSAFAPATATGARSATQTSTNNDLPCNNINSGVWVVFVALIAAVSALI
ncbi:hypothetical protein FRC03_010861 [Tulasnella sp. 419]|nr:hypothetical protein FRC02_010430 [Tulasnella sp. 418]KAG8967014.1 hypothetical protein FRC03_010861 [Tulasnella sp. 419]